MTDYIIFGGMMFVLAIAAYVVGRSINTRENLDIPLVMSERDLDKFSRDNWARVDKTRRVQCIEHLKSVIPDGVLKVWKINGFPEGFHMFNGGMAVRNLLRGVMTDDQLPYVQYASGEHVRNWDDFYMGCLAELLEGV